MSNDVSGFGHMVLVTNKSSVAIIIAYLFFGIFLSLLNWITKYEIERYLFYSDLIIKIWLVKINFQN